MIPQLTWPKENLQIVVDSLAELILDEFDAQISLVPPVVTPNYDDNQIGNNLTDVQDDANSEIQLPSRTNTQQMVLVLIVVVVVVGANSVLALNAS